MDSSTVRRFLEDFKTKMKIWDIVFMDNRAKNTQTLLQLEITPALRKKIINDLTPEDYSEGPVPDQQFMGNDLWVFGKEVKQQEVYIKITLGYVGKAVICISFHAAEYPMNFPLKPERK